MRKYKEYKDSGIEWIGDIPKHWDIKRLKYIYRLKKGKTPETLSTSEVNDYPYLTMEYLRGNPDQIYYCINIKNMVTVKDDDLLLLWDGSNAGEFITAKNGVLSSTMAKLSLIKGEKKYFYFVLKHNERILREFTIGMGIPHVSGDFLQDLLMLVPEIKEQESIADLLDNKTMQIDDLITKKEQMIELLKEERTAIINQAVTKGLDPNVEMKDSVIEWLGEIPKHWQINRLKHLNKKIGSGVTPKGGASVYESEGVLFLRSQNIHFDGLRLDDVSYISEIIHKDMINTRVIAGDVLLNITGASIGRCYYYPNNLGEANVNQHVCIIRPNKLITTKYLTYSLSSEIGQQQIVNSQNGISREGLNFEELASFNIPTPDIEEQNIIVKYLDTKIRQIDMQIERGKKSIELLREYRTALISEVVTGKIDVRN